MIKFIISLLILTTGFAFTSTVQAADLKVAGMDVTKAGNITGSGITGTVHFDGNKTLTLTDATITSVSSCIVNTGIDDLTIKIVGTVELVSSESHGVSIEKKTNIVSDFGSLWSTAKKDGYCAFWAKGGSTLRFSQIWAYARAYSFPVTGNGTEELHLDRCYLYAAVTNENSTYSCVSDFAEIKCWGVTYDYNGYKYDKTLKSMVDGSGNKVRSHTFYPRMSFGKHIENPNSNFTISGPDKAAGLTSGTITWNDETDVLTFDNVTLEAPSSFAAFSYYGLTSGTPTISIKGTNTIKTSQGSAAINLYKGDLSLSGTSASSNELIVQSKDADGIKIATSGSKIDIGLLSLIVEAKHHAINGNNSPMTITNSKVDTYTAESGYCGIRGISSCALNNCGVNTSATPVLFNSSKKGFAAIDGTLAGWVLIDIPKTVYSRVTVCGEPVTDLNANNILVEGLKAGKMVYIDSESYLGLNGVTLNSNGSNAIMVSDSDKKFTIRCDGGTSTITQKGNDAIYGLRNSAPLRLEGDNNLVVKVSDGASNAIRLFQTDLEVDLKGLEAEGTYCGIWGVNNSESIKLVRRSYNTQYNIKGDDCAINAGALTLEGLDFNSNYAPGCYFYNNATRQNGGTAVKSVRFSCYNTDYGFSVGGTAVNDCNMAGIGSPFITKGGTKAATFDGSKTLTLNAATIDCGKEYVNGIRNKSLDGLTIQLTGNNVITSSHTGYRGDNVPLYILSNTTITGSGTLTTEKLPVMVGSAELTFKDCKELAFRGGINAQNESVGATLVVDNSNVTAYHALPFFDNVTWPNGALVKPYQGYYDKTRRRIVDANGNEASEVVIGNKEAQGIETVATDSRENVNTVYDTNGRQRASVRKGLNIVRMNDGAVRKVIVE